MMKYPFTVFVTDGMHTHLFHRIEVKQDLSTVKIFFSKLDVEDD